MFGCLSARLSARPFVCLSVCLSVRLSVCLYVCLSLSLSLSPSLSLSLYEALPNFLSLFPNPLSPSLSLSLSLSHSLSLSLTLSLSLPLSFSLSHGSPDSTRHSPRLADKQRNTRSFGKTHTSMVEKYLTQRVQPRRRFLWNKLKCFSQTSLPMKIGVIALPGTKTFQTHLRKRSHCHRHHQHSLNFKRHCTQGATGQRQAQMAFQTQYGSVAHASMLRSLTSYSEFGSHARCLRPGSARRFDFSTNQDQRITQPISDQLLSPTVKARSSLPFLGKQCWKTC